MRIFKYLLPATVFAAGLLVSTATTAAKPEDTKKTRKPCATCHISAKGGKELTEAGKYYQEKGTLEGFDEQKSGSK